MAETSFPIYELEKIIFQFSLTLGGVVLVIQVEVNISVTNKFSSLAHSKYLAAALAYSFFHRYKSAKRNLADRNRSLLLKLPTEP